MNDNHCLSICSNQCQSHFSQSVTAILQPVAILRSSIARKRADGIWDDPSLTLRAYLFVLDEWINLTTTKTPVPFSSPVPPHPQPFSPTKPGEKGAREEDTTANRLHRILRAFALNQPAVPVWFTSLLVTIPSRYLGACQQRRSRSESGSWRLWKAVSD
jgi:hypothetical protein